MTRTANRTASIYTRVDPDTKKQAEDILEQLGIPMSNAIGMFLKQIVLQRGIPFEMKLPLTEPVSIGSLNKEQFDREIQKSVDDFEAGRTLTADEVEKNLQRLYKL